MAASSIISVSKYAFHFFSRHQGLKAGGSHDGRCAFGCPLLIQSSFCYIFSRDGVGTVLPLLWDTEDWNSGESLLGLWTLENRGRLGRSLELMEGTAAPPTGRQRNSSPARVEWGRELRADSAGFFLASPFVCRRQFWVWWSVVGRAQGKAASFLGFQVSEHWGSWLWKHRNIISAETNLRKGWVRLFNKAL